MLKKVVLLVIFLIILAFSGYGIYLSTNVQNFSIINTANTPNEPQSAFKSLIRTDFLKCPVQDQIEFLEYKSKSPNNIKNNKFGLYIYAENAKYFRIAKDLVNSNGGEWGYVLLPINISDRDKSKWNRVFNDLHNKKLIPVLQLYDIKIDSYKEDTQEMTEFLNLFIWPIKQRYISVYNEPNDSRFWLQQLDPAQYTDVLDYTIDTFKKTNSNFFILNGALNASAPNNLEDGYMSAETFLTKMHEHNPKVLNKLDGWASHSYPQPNFSGSPKDTGWWSIRAYEEELALLKRLGISKDLPVFITETGWAHSDSGSKLFGFYSSDQVGKNLVEAYEKVWLPDDRVVAVMPFTIYFKRPFEHFSWINDKYEPYPHFNYIKDLKKETGTPFVAQKSVFSSFLCL